MERYQIAEAAERSGLGVDELRGLAEAGIVRPDAQGRFSPSDVRRAAVVGSLAVAGIPLDGLASAIEDGQVSLDFLDTPVYERFTAFSSETFEQLAARLSVPVDLLMLVREAAGSAPPQPDDRVRDGEVAYAEFIGAQVAAGFRPAAIQQFLRVTGDSQRRMAESEAAWRRSEVLMPAIAAGRLPDDYLAAEFSERMSALSERAQSELYRLQQMQTWTGNIIVSLEMMLDAAGLHSRLEHPPAMCFLDITGYTRLTQERGDAVAADLATRLARLVQGTSVRHGGRPVKWLGDGVMFHFKDPGPGVVAALEMVAGVGDAGLPPAHVGLHAGPVIFQEGDYFGQTVNVASRIAEYARPGEVLVSHEVVEASGEAPVAFREIGPVELKGVTGPTRLYSASQPS